MLVAEARGDAPCAQRKSGRRDRQLHRAQQHVRPDGVLIAQEEVVGVVILGVRRRAEPLVPWLDAEDGLRADVGVLFGVKFRGHFLRLAGWRQGGLKLLALAERIGLLHRRRSLGEGRAGRQSEHCAGGEDVWFDHGALANHDHHAGAARATEGRTGFAVWILAD